MLFICVRTYADGKYINMVFPRIFTNYHECMDMCIDLQQKLGQESDERWIPFPLYQEDWHAYYTSPYMQETDKTIKEELYYVKRKNQRKGKEWSWKG